MATSSGAAFRYYEDSVSVVPVVLRWTSCIIDSFHLNLTGAAGHLILQQTRQNIAPVALLFSSCIIHCVSGGWVGLQAEIWRYAK